MNGHMTMGSLEQDIVKALGERSGAALATVISRAGSAPRGVGAKLLLRPDGTSTGSIGGGSLEAKVLHEGQAVIQTGQAMILDCELTAEDLAEDGAICGGDVKIFIEPLPAGVPDLLHVYQTIVNIRKRGPAALLATVVSVNGSFSRGRTSKALIDREGKPIVSLLAEQGLIDAIRPEIDRTLRENRSRTSTIHTKGKRFDLLLEPIPSEPTVFVFGCGHISICLAPLIKTVGFRLVVADDRPSFANRDRFPQADDVVVDRFEGLLERLAIEEHDYLVIVTRGHLHDLVVLEQALRTNATYIGMIGSRRKTRLVYEELVQRGVPRTRLGRVHAPIGLEIGAETPEEIAVSILAELIQVRAGTK